MKTPTIKSRSHGVQNSDARLERLSRYLFTAPPWPVPLVVFTATAGCIDLILMVSGTTSVPVTTLLFTVPVLWGFLTTKPAVGLQKKPMTWNRSALLSAATGLIGLILTGLGIFVSGDRFPLWYGLALACIFGIRLMVLVAISDSRVSRMTLPAFLETIPGILLGGVLIPGPFVLLALVLHGIFWVGFSVFFWLIDQPMEKAFHFPGLSLLNAYVAHHTDGSKGLEVFFRRMGEEVCVPEVSILFRTHDGDRETLITVPNVHPGPMGDVGGSNLPCLISRAFPCDVMVPHGCATHDFNLVSADETDKIVNAVRSSWDTLEFSEGATPSFRVVSGSVSVLAQRFGESLLLVGTRSPLKTEDLEFALGLAIMGEGRRYNSHIAFIDAHNCMTRELTPILAGSKVSTEYLSACQKAGSESRVQSESPFQAGYSHMELPYSREEGYGDLGLQALVIRVGNQTTAYVLFDGNNMAAGVREGIRSSLLELVDEAEVMTTDTHVVNMESGKNPVGGNPDTDPLYQCCRDVVQQALLTLTPSKAAGSTVWCDGVVVFGPNRIAQLASTIGTILVYVPPLALGMLLLAFILSIFAYLTLY